MIQKKTNVNLVVSVLFPACYRINRHGRKVAKVVIFCEFDETQNKPDLRYETRCRIFPEKSEITWEFPKNCNNAITEAVKGLFTEEEIFNIFEEMEDKYR